MRVLIRRSVDRSYRAVRRKGPVGGGSDPEESASETPLTGVMDRTDYSSMSAAGWHCLSWRGAACVNAKNPVGPASVPTGFSFLPRVAVSRDGRGPTYCGGECCGWTRLFSANCFSRIVPRIGKRSRQVRVTGRPGLSLEADRMVMHSACQSTQEKLGPRQTLRSGPQKQRQNQSSS